jgi:hypothetical protein
VGSDNRARPGQRSTGKRYTWGKERIVKATLALTPAKTGSGSYQPTQRLVLYPDELYRVPATYQKLRVVTGTAFVTQAARDLIAGPGREISLERKGGVALISPLRTDALVVELYCGKK